MILRGSLRGGGMYSKYCLTLWGTANASAFWPQGTSSACLSACIAGEMNIEIESPFPLKEAQMV